MPPEARGGQEHLGLSTNPVTAGGRAFVPDARAEEKRMTAQYLEDYGALPARTTVYKQPRHSGPESSRMHRKDGIINSPFTSIAEPPLCDSSHH